MVLMRKDMKSSPSKLGRFNKGSPRVSHGPRTPRGLLSCSRSLTRASSEANVKVVVRVRPQNKKELASNARTVVKVVDEKMLIFDPQEEEEQSFFYRGVQQRGRDMLKRQHKHTQFLFDRVFGFDSTNQQVFEESTKDIITSVLDGYNCSVFVYGATGAGKTFTMLGKEDNPGIMFLTMVGLFERMEQLKVDRDFEMGVSYLEVYNETVHDLITGSTPLYLREDANGVFVSGLKIERINDTKRLFELLAEGNKNRTQHPTDANAESSRSHAVFQVYLKMTTKGHNQTKMVKLSMIDLAGSERGSATNCAGVRFKEGSSINKSLLALGNCINKLADGLPHIPYRDSKLTRILKDSLGGNCRTVMVANVSPSHTTFEDTLNTLRYAKRAKMIKSTVKKNIVSVEMHVSHYIKMVDDLKEENARLKADLANATAALEASRCLLAANPVYTTPAKTAPSPRVVEKDDDVLQNLLDEVEKLFSEKQELQRRYLQMDSKEKVLQWRIKCKERSVARVEQLSDTPTNPEEAKFRASRSVKQFCGQLDTAVGCQEELAEKRRVLNEQLKSLRDKASALGLGHEFSEKVEKMDLEFQNAQLEEQQAHLQKFITLLSKEKDDQDLVVTELSSAFRRYYNLLRGHGHMTDTMLREHKTLVRRFEGLKTVNWQEAEDDESTEGPPPLSSVSKLSLGESPLITSTSVPAPLLSPVHNAKSLETSIKLSDENVEGCEPLKFYKSDSFDIDRIKRDIEKISSMASIAPSALGESAKTCEIDRIKRDIEKSSSSSVTAPSALEETVKACEIDRIKRDIEKTTAPPAFEEATKVLNDSLEEDEFCVQGKFANFNATFDKLDDVDVQRSEDVDKLGATITKVDNLLNESYTVQGRSLNVTYDTEYQELNKTFDKGEPGESAVANSAGSSLNVTFTNDAAKEEQTKTVAISDTVVKLTPSSDRKEKADLDTTYRLVPESQSKEAKTGTLPCVRGTTVSPNIVPRTSPAARISPCVRGTIVSPEIVPRISPAARKSPCSSQGPNQVMTVAEKAIMDSTFQIQAESHVSAPTKISPYIKPPTTSFQASTKSGVPDSTPQHGHKFVRPNTVSFMRANAASVNRPKIVVTFKKPLQESNNLRRERIPLKGAAVYSKSTVPHHAKAPIAANATCMSLERKFPLYQKSKPKTLLVNKENGAPRKT